MKTRLYIGLGIALVFLVVVAIVLGFKLNNTSKGNLFGTQPASAQKTTTAAQNGIPGPAPKVVSKDSTFQKTGFMGLGAAEMVVTANITNKGGPGQVTVTATIYGGHGSRSKSVSVYFAPGQQWQQVIITIPNLEGNESYDVTVQ